MYNNKKILNEWLLKSLEKQTSKYELILLDNTTGQFESASNALNRGGKKAKGEYIMFVHQDVELSSVSWLKDAEKNLEFIPNLGIAGVAGMSEKGNTPKERGRNVIKSGGRIWEWGNPIQKPEPVQTLDECLVIIPKSVFNLLQFDEKVCNDWHLYAVDYCLSARESGRLIYAIPMFINHKSTGASTYPKICFQSILSLGSYPKGYYQTLEKVLRKHKNYFKRIYTTCKDWRTSYPLILQRAGHLAKGGLNCLLKKLRKK